MTPDELRTLLKDQGPFTVWMADGSDLLHEIAPGELLEFMVVCLGGPPDPKGLAEVAAEAVEDLLRDCFESSYGDMRELWIYPLDALPDYEAIRGAVSKAFEDCCPRPNERLSEEFVLTKDHIDVILSFSS